MDYDHLFPELRVLLGGIQLAWDEKKIAFILMGQRTGKTVLAIELTRDEVNAERYPLVIGDGFTIREMSDCFENCEIQNTKTLYDSLSRNKFSDPSFKYLGRLVIFEEVTWSKLNKNELTHFITKLHEMGARILLIGSPGPINLEFSSDICWKYCASTIDINPYVTFEDIVDHLEKDFPRAYRDFGLEFVKDPEIKAKIESYRNKAKEIANS